MDILILQKKNISQSCLDLKNPIKEIEQKFNVKKYLAYTYSFVSEYYVG